VLDYLKMLPIKIGPITVGAGSPPFIIAELSGNHNQSIEKALLLVDLAAEAGAHAVKLQTYTADSITIDSDKPDFIIHDQKSLWSGRKLYDLYQEASTPYEWHNAIFKRCAERGLICFSTPFDEAGVDFLEQFAPPCYKIASFENNHFPLIRKVVKTRKPVLISLGLATKEFIDELDNFLRQEGADQVIFLKCTSAYPASPEDANLRGIPYLIERFGRPVGLSDHTMGTTVPITSIGLGACVIEKHFTDSRAAGGVDSAFSLEPAELRDLVNSTLIAWKSLGNDAFKMGADEQRSLQFKRSIYVTRDIRAGEPFSERNLGIIRPGFGLAPKHFDSILGKTAKTDLFRGQPLYLDHVLGVSEST
jgi:pseudaminic acid synthase